MKQEQMVSLVGATGHYSGIIIAGDGIVYVCDWERICGQDANKIVLIGLFGIPIPWEVKNLTIEEVCTTDDVRKFLPGKYFLNEDGEWDTDMSVLSDDELDIAALFVGVHPTIPPEEDFPVELGGTIFKMVADGDEFTVITIDGWE